MKKEGTKEGRGEKMKKGEKVRERERRRRSPSLPFLSNGLRVENEEEEEEKRARM